MLSPELEVDETSVGGVRWHRKHKGVGTHTSLLLIKVELVMTDVPFFLLFLLMQGPEHQAVDQTSMTNRVLKW